MELVYLRREGQEYEFACYPSDLELPWIMEGLSRIGEVQQVDTILASDNTPIGIIRVQFVTDPLIETETKRHTLYYRQTVTVRIQNPVAQYYDPRGFPEPYSQYSSIVASPIYYSSCEGTAKVGEEGRPESSSTDEGTYIFFIPTPNCSVKSLFEEFGKLGKLDYIYPAKARRGEKRFGYARYIEADAARKALESHALRKFRCKPGRKPQLTRLEKADPYLAMTTSCQECFLAIQRKTVGYHRMICQKQRKEEVTFQNQAQAMEVELEN